MPRCAHCGGLISGRPENCPVCLAPLADRAAGLWPVPGERDDFHVPHQFDEPAVTIARFNNVAEAGFFAHELMHHESLPVQLSVDESFDAIGGYWKTRFLLSVPQSPSCSR